MGSKREQAVSTWPWPGYYRGHRLPPKVFCFPLAGHCVGNTATATRVYTLGRREVGFQPHLPGPPLRCNSSVADLGHLRAQGVLDRGGRCGSRFGGSSAFLMYFWPRHSRILTTQVLFYKREKRGSEKLSSWTQVTQGIQCGAGMQTQSWRLYSASYPGLPDQLAAPWK